jgi:hypothetical protein
MAAPLKPKSIKFTNEQLRHLRHIAKTRDLGDGRGGGISKAVKLLIDEDMRSNESLLADGKVVI